MWLEHVVMLALLTLFTFCPGFAAGHQSSAAATTTNLKCFFLSLLSSWDALWWQLERNKQQQSIASARGTNDLKHFVVYDDLFTIKLILVLVWPINLQLETLNGMWLLKKIYFTNFNLLFICMSYFLVHGWRVQHSPLLGSWTRRSPCSRVWMWGTHTASTSKWWITGSVAIMNLTLTTLQ